MSKSSVNNPNFHNGYDPNLERLQRLANGLLAAEDMLQGQSPDQMFPGEPVMKYAASGPSAVDNPHSLLEGPVSFIALVGIAAHFDRPNLLAPDTAPHAENVGEDHMSGDFLWIIAKHAEEIADLQGVTQSQILLQLRQRAWQVDPLSIGDPRYESPDLEFNDFAHEIGFFGNGGNYDSPQVGA